MSERRKENTARATATKAREATAAVVETREAVTRHYVAREGWWPDTMRAHALEAKRTDGSNGDSAARRRSVAIEMNRWLRARLWKARAAGRHHTAALVGRAAASVH
jgi:hypothetical protein